jgi:hypothetical protein
MAWAASSPARTWARTLTVAARRRQGQEAALEGGAVGALAILVEDVDQVDLAAARADQGEGVGHGVVAEVRQIGRDHGGLPARDRRHRRDAVGRHAPDRLLASCRSTDDTDDSRPRPPFCRVPTTIRSTARRRRSRAGDRRCDRGRRGTGTRSRPGRAARPGAARGRGAGTARGPGSASTIDALHAVAAGDLVGVVDVAGDHVDRAERAQLVDERDRRIAAGRLVEADHHAQRPGLRPRPRAARRRGPPAPGPRRRHDAAGDAAQGQERLARASPRDDTTSRSPPSVSVVATSDSTAGPATISMRAAGTRSVDAAAIAVVRWSRAAAAAASGSAASGSSTWVITSSRSPRPRQRERGLHRLVGVVGQVGAADDGHGLGMVPAAAWGPNPRAAVRRHAGAAQEGEAETEAETEAEAEADRSGDRGRERPRPRPPSPRPSDRGRVRVHRGPGYPR